jgi:hypothetical protein
MSGYQFHLSHTHHADARHRGCSSGSTNMHRIDTECAQRGLPGSVAFRTLTGGVAE